MTTVHIVTRRFHHAGMDEQTVETLGVFSTSEAACKLAFLEDCRFLNIADETQVEEFEIDLPVGLDEDDKDQFLDTFLNNPEVLIEPVVLVLDELWPEWRADLEKARSEAE